MGVIERKQKIFYKKTKRGNILKVVREHYLRDDVWCSVAGCQECKGDDSHLSPPTVSPSNLVPKPHILVIDTNVALHQIDFLSHDSVCNVVVPQTVLQEVRHRSLPIYKRLRDVIDLPSKNFYVFSNEHHSACYVERVSGESSNDRNDTSIRLSCWWYSSHLQRLGVHAILLTDDVGCRSKAHEMMLSAYSVREYVASLTDSPGLLDLVASVDSAQDEENSFKKLFYDPHWSLEKIRAMIKRGELRQGVLRMSRSNCLEGSVMVEGMDEPIIVQGRSHLNRALHDDVVALQLLDEECWVGASSKVIEREDLDDAEEKDPASVEADNSRSVECALLATEEGAVQRQPTARVVGIIRRKWRQYCGIIKPSQMLLATRHLFVPADRRIPYIRLETRQVEQLIGKRIIVALDSWPRDSRNPKGHFVRVLGDIGDHETENEVVLLEHDCPHTAFAEAVLKCLPQMPWVITEKDKKERLDLRHVDICSVDPVGCTDIDDALHCRRLDNGNYEVGVHIADVSHFIRPGTALDKEAQHRSTSVYLTSRRIDMVPDLLSSNLCSLRGNVDRFAFSVIWELNEDGVIVDHRFCKSIICSRGEMSYEQAQQRIDDPNVTDSLTESLRDLNRIAKKLKAKRINDGALVLASMEVKFHVDPDTDSVVDIVAKQHLETMSMVEEFMLLANVTAANTTLQHFPDCAMLRRHPAPPASNFEPLLLACKSQSVELDVTSNKTLAESLNKCDREGNPFFNSMLRIMTTRCMMQALYFCSGTLEYPEYNHYGLATPTYTHFTSPIRRYADIIVHRLLGVIIDADTTYPELLDVKKQTELAQHINYRHKMAQYAGRASGAITAVSALKNKTMEYEAYVLFLHQNALQVLVPAIGQQMTLYLDYHLKDRKAALNAKKEELKLKGIVWKEENEKLEDLPTFEFNEKELFVQCGDVVLRPFDELVIQASVDTSDVQHQRIVTKLVLPAIPGYSVPSIRTSNAGKSDDIELETSQSNKLKPIAKVTAFVENEETSDKIRVDKKVPTKLRQNAVKSNNESTDKGETVTEKRKKTLTGKKLKPEAGSKLPKAKKAKKK
ncbi:PIN domain [Trinorchestia longiramus]|nr:PIN domain [Trinorchestia longiramus]